MPIPPPAKRAAIVAAALLLGAPTAGAALRSEAAVTPNLSSGILQIIQVIPPEPEIHPVYPLETVDQPLTNEFKRPPRASHWGYGFPGMEAVAMSAEPQGAPIRMEAEPPRAQVHASIDVPAAAHSSFEPATGWLDEE